MSEALDTAFGMGMGEGDLRFPSVLDRLIHLRTLPTLGRLAASGLTYVASHAVERHFEPGELVYSPDRPVDAVHFIAEGRVRVEQEGLHILDGVPPFVIGFFPVLSQSTTGQRAVAVEPTVTLELARPALLEVFEDDFGFLENAIRQMSRQMVEMQRELEARGLLERSTPEQTPYPHEPLDLVERLDLMGRDFYADSNIEPFVQLVRMSQEVRYEPGDLLWETGDPSSWGLNVAHGVVRCEGEDRVFRVGPGSSLGYIECYGVLPRSYRATAETRVVALRQPGEAFIDVLEDHPKLALSVASMMAGFVLGLSLKVAQAQAAAPVTDESE